VETLRAVRRAHDEKTRLVDEQKMAGSK